MFEDPSSLPGTLFSYAFMFGSLIRSLHQLAKQCDSDLSAPRAHRFAQRAPFAPTGGLARADQLPVFQHAAACQKLSVAKCLSKRGWMLPARPRQALGP